MNTKTPEQIVSYTDASRIVREQAAALDRAIAAIETVTLLEALGRVLANAVLADRDQPPFPRSTRDGFACRAADFAASRVVRIIGSIRAGETGSDTQQALQVRSGECVEIMTGAPVPSGADCVVMIEHVQRQGDSLHLAEDRRPAAGENIVPQAAEARAGGVILPEGTRLTPIQVGAAAACGQAELTVYARPRVAIVATGDELVELDCTPMPSQIRNSNSYSLAAQVLATGGQPMRLPIARDERAHLESVIRSGLDSDLLLLSGGVSMGKYDLVEEVLVSLGAEFFFTGALIQPGKPVVFGRIPSLARPLYFFGLPGNPVSTMVTFALFVVPLLSALCGERARGPRFGLARLTHDVDVKRGLTRFLPALQQASDTEVNVTLVAWQGSGDLAGTSRSDCFLVIPLECSHLSAGETVTILLA